MTVRVKKDFDVMTGHDEYKYKDCSKKKEVSRTGRGSEGYAR